MKKQFNDTRCVQFLIIMSVFIFAYFIPYATCLDNPDIKRTIFGSPVDWFYWFYWLIDWLVGWLIDWFYLFFYLLIDVFIDVFNDRLIDWLIDWLIDMHGHYELEDGQ